MSHLTFIKTSVQSVLYKTLFITALSQAKSILASISIIDSFKTAYGDSKKVSFSFSLEIEVQDFEARWKLAKSM